MTSIAVVYASRSGRSSWAYIVVLPQALLAREPRVARAISSATAASSSSSGTTRFTSPQSSAVRASMTSPVSASSMARLRPTFRAIATIGVWQNQPPFPPGAAKPADSAATARSQEATSWQPAAVARACTRAITTCGTDCRVPISSVHSASRLRTSVTGWPATSAKSWPALNTGPSPASTMPVASLSPAAMTAASSWVRCSRDSALRLAARVMVMRTVSPLRSVRGAPLPSMPDLTTSGAAAAPLPPRRTRPQVVPDSDRTATVRAAEGAAYVALPSAGEEPARRPGPARARERGMTQGRGQQDRGHGVGLWLALAAALALAAGLAVWSLSVRDRDAPAEAAATSSTTAPGPSPSAPSSTASPATLTAAALLTAADVATAGLTVADPIALDAPELPVLCDAPDWGTQWSAPQQGLGQQYPAQGARVTEYAAGYADEDAASAALARLVTDAATCPDVAAGGSVESAGPATAVDGESAVLTSSGSGRDGAIAVTWSVVVRSGPTLLLTSYATEQQIGTGADGDDSAGDGAGARVTAEALARAAVERFTAHA